MRKGAAWAAVALVASAAAVGTVFVGCGSDEDNGTPPADDGGGESSTNPNPNPNDDGGLVDVNQPTCKAMGEGCTSSVECCTENCVAPDGGGASVCGSPTAMCKTPGETCASATECCTTSCVGGKCSDKQCVADNGACNAGTDCCGQTCTNHVCVPINTTCKSDGNPCGAPGALPCCSGQCNNGVCGNASYCTQKGDLCASDAECCGRLCTKAAGAAYGTCADLPSAGGCEPAGTLCGTGTTPSACDNKCCSKACGPWGTTNIRVCQPPSGCKPQYEVCSSDDDCCGNDPNPTGGLDPAKQPTCEKDVPTDPYGRCTKANTCDPPGAVCKLAACGVENRCCDPIGAPSSYCQNDPANCCKYDALGIPRCIYSATCQPANGTCASSADCCNTTPCVNGKCQAGCVNTTGACTTTADCCTGLSCVNGTCGGTTTTDGGTTDASTGTCALYGQTCGGAVTCCNGVPCTAGFCRYP